MLVHLLYVDPFFSEDFIDLFLPISSHEVDSQILPFGSMDFLQPTDFFQPIDSLQPIIPNESISSEPPFEVVNISMFFKFFSIPKRVSN